MEFRQVGEALDGARRLGMIGGELAGSQFVHAGSNETTNLRELVGAATPAGAEKAADAEAPAQWSGHEGGGTYPGGLVVIAGSGRGRTHPKASKPLLGVRPRLVLATIDGVRVHHGATTARKAE